MRHQPRIAIVGAGPAGLTLAVLLHKLGLKPAVYDFRPRPTEHDLSQPTGMLDMHQESGLAAIRACGLMDRFQPLTGECAECMIVTDAAGNYLYSEEPGTGRPEISRNALQGLLLSALPEDAVRWGTKVLGARADDGGSGGGGTTTLEFGTGNHSSGEFDLVVGADGAWSRIRPLVTDARPRDMGKRYATLVVRNISERHPALAKFIGEGTLMALGSGMAIATQRTTADSAWFYVIVSSKSPVVGGSGDATSTADIPLDPLTLKARLLDDSGPDGQNFASWGPQLRELIATACDEAAAAPDPQPIPFKTHAMLPVGLKWASRPGATLIGDAAHLMMPVGEGVNMAMWDALELYEAIAAALQESQEKVAEEDDPAAGFRARLAAHVQRFEAAMFERAGETARESLDTFQMMLGEDGGRRLAAMLAGFKGQGPPA